MSDLTYTYRPAETPFVVGHYDGDDILCFGGYKTVDADGFCCLTPHTGFPGTVSEEPAPLDDEQVRGHLARLHDEARAAHAAAHADVVEPTRREAI